MEKAKQRMLSKLREECQAMVRGVYPDREKVLVFGEGNLDARIMLIGEAPGEQETLQKRPFVGKAGKNLDAFVEALGITREELYITNVVKFRPFKIHPRTGTLSNRPPDKEEIGLFYSSLVREVEIVDPAVVVTLGNTALKALLDDRKAAIGALHGRPLTLPGEKTRTLFPLYHPASIIYNPKLVEVYQEDLQKLKALMENPEV